MPPALQANAADLQGTLDKKNTVDEKLAYLQRIDETYKEKSPPFKLVARAEAMLKADGKPASSQHQAGGARSASFASPAQPAGTAAPPASATSTSSLFGTATAATAPSLGAPPSVFSSAFVASATPSLGAALPKFGASPAAAPAPPVGAPGPSGTHAALGFGTQGSTVQLASAMFGGAAPPGSSVHPTFGASALGGAPAASKTGTTHARVAEIYAKYNPDKLGEVDTIVQKYAGREAQLIAALEKKYNIPAGSAPGTGPSGGGGFVLPPTIAGGGVSAGEGSLSVPFGNGSGMSFGQQHHVEQPPPALSFSAMQGTNAWGMQAPFAGAAAQPGAQPPPAFGAAPPASSTFGSSSGAAGTSWPGGFASFGVQPGFGAGVNPGPFGAAGPAFGAPQAAPAFGMGAAPAGMSAGASFGGGPPAFGAQSGSAPAFGGGGGFGGLSAQAGGIFTPPSAANNFTGAQFKSRGSKPR